VVQHHDVKTRWMEMYHALLTLSVDEVHGELHGPAVLLPSMGPGAYGIFGPYVRCREGQYVTAENETPIGCSWDPLQLTDL
jgi:hypothetical protein